MKAQARHTATGREDAASLVVGVLMGVVRFRLRLCEGSDAFADVLDPDGNVIGSAHQFYADGGWSIQTRPFGGYVKPSEVEIVNPRDARQR